MNDLAIAIPLYEGAATVGDVVRGARASGFPVVVVDDGSTDGGAQLAEAAGAIVLRHSANHGKGAALATAFAWAARRDARAVLTLDADGQHDPVEIPRLAAAWRTAPRALVIGVRAFDDAMPRRSRVGNRISTYWISRFANRTLADSQSGFRVYPRELFAGPPLRTSRFDTEAELLLRAAKYDLPFIEIPIRTIYASDRSTHFRNFRDTLRIMKLVIGSPLWKLDSPSP